MSFFTIRASYRSWCLPSGRGSLRLYGKTINGYGATPCGAVQWTSDDGDTILTEFRIPGTEELVGVVGFAAT